MPFFSVIIPSYNRYSQLKNAIESVLAQSFTDFELIVIDDGSTDHTPEIENQYTGRLKYLRQKNSGVSSARNRGIEISSSPYIAFLDSDDLWLPDKLKEHHLFIENNPDILIHQTDEVWIRNGKRVNPGKKHKKKSGIIFAESLGLCFISPSAVVLKREMFKTFGMFDEDMAVCEDYDLWLRITCMEKVGLIEKKLTIKHGGHESQLSRSFPVMDIYRVYSIMKLLKEKNGLDPSYRKLAEDTARKKCSIIISGAKKREKSSLIDIIEKLIQGLDNKNYNNIDFRNLLKEAPAP